MNAGQIDAPRVVVVCGGKFWSYEIARAAQRAGWLRYFVTTIFDESEAGLPREKIVEVPWPAHAARLIARLPFSASQAWSYSVGDNWFDLAARRFAAEAEIYHAYNHHALHGMRVARRAGAITVIERGSAHPRFVDNLLRDEYSRFGLRYPAAHRGILAKHLQEYAEADCIRVPSDFVHRTMVQEGVPASKLRRVHAGVSLERFRPAPKADDVFRVLFVGALSLQKGLPYLLEAFRRAGLPRDRSELVLVGEAFPDARAFLPKYQGLYRRVRFVRHGELADLYRSGSVLVLPSVQDGFGMVVYEAAACGLPAIVSENVGAALRDHEHGFVVPIRDPDAIAEKLVYLFEHEGERRHMGAAACRYVGQFTWQRFQDEVLEHYRELRAALT